MAGTICMSIKRVDFLTYLLVFSLLGLSGGSLKDIKRPSTVDPKLDCAIRELAWEYAKKLQPQRGDFKSAYDALRLKECGTHRSKHQQRGRNFVSPRLSASILIVYADSERGRDDNPGTLDKPVKSLQRAVELTRSTSPPGSPKVIFLREGTFFLDKPILLEEEDSFLTISSYKGEHAIVSGGKRYNFTWTQHVREMRSPVAGYSFVNDMETIREQGVVKAYGTASSTSECAAACRDDSYCFAYTHFTKTSDVHPNQCFLRVGGFVSRKRCTSCTSGRKVNIVSTDLSTQSPNVFTSLFINGRRAVRARYPDGNPETTGLYTNNTGYVSKADGWLAPQKYPPAVEINIEAPQRNGTHFPLFQVGLGGPVEMFNPPQSYWGQRAPNGGVTYEVPSGLEYPSDVDFVNRTWSNPDTGIVHAFHGRHWGNWLFKLADRDEDLRYLTFGSGGFQEARGSRGGAEWYVENIFEELDSPGEWFYNQSTKTLYLYPNGSLPTEGIGTNLESLIEIRGSTDSLVVNVTLLNLEFAHSATTFLSDYEVPSGGDWSVHRGGTVFVEGTKKFLLQNCLFNAPGGNGLCLSGYNRNAVIEGNEFVWSGDSGIVALGTSEHIDGTLGNQPRGTKIMRNLVHENGVFGKQTSAYMQALACQTELIDNVFFNGPRAGINFNDGFGGGNLLKNNLIFNHVRETQDHGQFNSWDRLPYLTDVKPGTASLMPALSNVTRNFIINTYNSLYPIDHDDGSCYYLDTYNYLIYGGYKNHLGHSKTVQNNVYVYPDINPGKPFCGVCTGASRDHLPSGWGEVYSNNTCLIGNPNIYEFWSCNLDDPKGLIPFTAFNKFYAPNKDVYIKCQDAELSLYAFQKLGYDKGSTVSDPVDTATVIKWGKDLLGM